MARRATVILVHWNQPEALARTVESFTQNSLVDRVIVVDNGSTSKNRTLIEELVTPAIMLIDVGRNSGFGPAANRGWEAWLDDPDGSEWSILAPHDALADADTIPKLFDAIDAHPNAGLLSADVGDGSSPFVDHVFGPILRPASTEEGFEAVDYPHGTLMMASRKCLSQIGLFDERYFAYCEEADLGLRAQAAGFEVGLVRGARVTNPNVGTPSPVVEYLMERNTILLIAMHFGKRKAALRFLLMIFQLVRGVLQPQHRTPYWSARARVLAIIDVLRRRFGPPPFDRLVERG